VLPRLSAAASRQAGATLGTFTAPGNPIDAYGIRWDSGQLRAALTELAPTTTIGVLDAPASSGGDALIAREVVPMFAQLHEATGDNFIVLNTTVASGTDPGTVASGNTLGVPILSGLQTALAAIAKWARYAPPDASPPAARKRTHPAARPLREALSDGRPAPALAAGILTAGGFPMAPVVVARSARAAAAVADSLGFPVVLKGNGDGILHKHDLGLVALGIGNAAAARAAFRELGGRLEAIGVQRPEITVQPYERGLELFVGARNDDTFGPVVVVGVGGTQVDATRAVSLHVGPIDRRTARSLLLASPAGELLRRQRAGARPDVAAAVAAVVELSALAASLEDIVESIEINPLVVRDDGLGVAGVDLVITTKSEPA
jgi:acyl-CoA synthetase (NDP forming)